MTDDLRARFAAALREAGRLCDDDCPDPAACDAAHPIQATVLNFDQVTDIEGPVDAIAELASSVVQPELERLRVGIPLVCSDERHAAKVAALNTEVADWRNAAYKHAKELADAISACRSTAALLRSTADRVEAGPAPDPLLLRMAARDLDEVADRDQRPRMTAEDVRGGFWPDMTGGRCSPCHLAIMRGYVPEPDCPDCQPTTKE